MNSRKWIGATLFAALLLGVGVGVLLDRFVLLPSVAGDVSPRRGRHEDHGRKFRARLHEELALSAEQQARLDEVLGRNHEIAERFWKESRERFDDLRVTFRADIRELLTAEQVVKFDRLLAEHDEKRRNRDAR
jgi:hypothetical protein